MRTIAVWKYEGLEPQMWSLWRLAWSLGWRMAVIVFLIGFIWGLIGGKTAISPTVFLTFI